MQSLKNETSSQQYEIPATRRSDGSWRKARRVRPGFVPQEEVPVYMPKGKRIAQANASPFPPGWFPDAAKVQTTKPKKQQQQKQPAVKSEAPQVKIMTKTSENVDELANSMENNLKIREDVIEISKRLKRLRRRLRELEILEEKINSGEISKPQKDQLEKIQRRGELKKEIEELEMQRDELKAKGGIKNLDEES